MLKWRVFLMLNYCSKLGPTLQWQNLTFHHYCTQLRYQITINILNITVEWLVPLLHIRQVLDSNLGPGTGCCHWVVMHALFIDVKTGTGENITALWDIVPYRLAKVERHSRSTYCLQHWCHHLDGESVHLWNTDLIQWDYTALYPKGCDLHTWCHEKLKSHSVLEKF
jgi:hypothetical protein